jgi:penicillin-binding protein A
VAAKATIDGVDLQNAGGELCGGTVAESFAKSCNSVFAPLGVRVGADRLVHTAERHGFNEQPSIAGALPSAIPAAGGIGSQLALGSTAIAQGEVLATPLELASVSQTIASLDIELDPLAVGNGPRPLRVDLEIERPVLDGRDRQLEQQQRAANRPAGGGAAGRRHALLRP